MQFCSTSEVRALVQTHYRECSDLNVWIWMWHHLSSKLNSEYGWNFRLK